MRVVFMGTPGFAVAPLERLVAEGHDVAAVYTQPDRAAGRGRMVAASPVKLAALSLDLPVVQPDRLTEAGAGPQISGLRPDVVVVAAYGQLVPPAVLDVPVFGCVNIHPSLLPRYRGASPVPAAILNGDTFSGVSIMLLDQGWDTGPVLTRAQIPVADDDTTGSLTEKLSRIGADVLLDVLARLGRREVTPKPQNEACASYSSAIHKEAGEIDWSLPAVDVWRRVRAFQPWPGCYTRWRGRLLKVLRAVPLPPEEAPGGDGVRAGTVVGVSWPGVGFGVVTGDGVLGVARVQAEGKRPVAAADFLRGQRVGRGEVLPS